MVFICGEIKDLVSDSDKHYAYLEDPDDIDLNNKFSGLNEDEVEDLKHEYVLFGIHFAWLTNDYQVGNAATWPPRTQPPHPQLPEENRQGVT